MRGGYGQASMTGSWIGPAHNPSLIEDREPTGDSRPQRALTGQQIMRYTSTGFFVPAPQDGYGL
jgi:hypothetical protein